MMRYVVIPLVAVLLWAGIGCTDGGVDPSPQEASGLMRDCGMAVELPTSRENLVHSLHELGISSYVRQAPRLAKGTGDDVFPVRGLAPRAAPEAVEAIVALCGSQREGAIRKSIRYAFFIDASGTVFHVERRTVSTVILE